MECPNCGREVEPYWADASYGHGTKYYKCSGCEHHWNSTQVEPATATVTATVGGNGSGDETGEGEE